MYLSAVEVLATGTAVEQQNRLINQRRTGKKRRRSNWRRSASGVKTIKVVQARPAPAFKNCTVRIEVTTAQLTRAKVRLNENETNDTVYLLRMSRTNMTTTFAVGRKYFQQQKEAALLTFR
ncbi:hypothetical protein T06_2434 [Trichinella sp. T6]|nr:hypothetical protein T06_2434 [Trichinella sp. T6]